MWFLIGSRAIQTIREDFYRDITQSDLDLYCSKEDFNQWMTECSTLEKCFPLKKNKYRIKIKNSPVIELKIYDEGSIYHWLSMKEQQSLFSDKKYHLNHLSLNILNLNCLKIIKESHLYWPIHWLKNVEDFTWLKEKTKDSLFTDKELEFLKLIKKEMKNLHGNIPSGKLSDLSLIKEQIKKEQNQENIVKFIHNDISLKNKLRIIQNWNDIKCLTKENNIKPKNKLC